MPLYGHELGEDISVLSSGMDFAIKVDKEASFIGQEALRREVDAGGPAQVIVGLDVEGRRTARHGMAVMCGDRRVGHVTSGCMSPMLAHPIAMALVDREVSGVGTELAIDAGRASLVARVRALPFFKSGS